MSYETAPHARFGEDGNSTTPPLPDPAYPQSDVVPSATGITEVPNQHAEYEQATSEAFETRRMLEELARENAELRAQVKSQAKPVPEPVYSPSNGGEPVPHHLHLVDGRVIQNHGGIGTHYSEVLANGSTKVTRIEKYFPANEVDPATLNA